MGKDRCIRFIQTRRVAVERTMPRSGLHHFHIIFVAATTLRPRSQPGDEVIGDPQLAAAHVLGSEAGMAAGALLAEEVVSILTKGLEENLVAQVLGGVGGMPSAERNDAITNILKAFLSGLKG